MSKHRTISLALAGALAFSASALAQDSQDNNQDRQERRDERMARVDTNGDGAVSIDEFMAAPFGADIDADDDGLITQEEYVANWQRNIPARVRGDVQRRRGGGQRPDGGQGAGVEREQLRARVEQRLSERFANLDGDEDGVISVAEYRSEQFNNLDRDGDGLLQSSELRGSRRGPGGPRGAGQSPDQGN